MSTYHVNAYDFATQAMVMEDVPFLTFRWEESIRDLPLLTTSVSPQFRGALHVGDTTTIANLEPGRTLVAVLDDNDNVYYAGVVWSWPYAAGAHGFDVAGESMWSWWRRKRFLRDTSGMFYSTPTANPEVIRFDGVEQMRIAIDVLLNADEYAGTNAPNVSAQTMNPGGGSGVMQSMQWQSSQRRTIGDAIEELCRQDNGFDFQLTATHTGGDYLTFQMNYWYPRIGTMTGMFGQSVIDGDNASISALERDARDMANPLDAFMLLADGSGAFVGQVRDPNMKGHGGGGPDGEFPMMDGRIIAAPGRDDEAALSLAANRMRYTRGPIYRATLDMVLDSGLAFTDIGLGDTVDFAAGVGGFNVHAQQRVFAKHVLLTDGEVSQWSIDLIDDEASIGEFNQPEPTEWTRVFFPGLYPDEVMIDTPVLWWRLGENAGTVFVDSSGNGHDSDAADLFNDPTPVAWGADALIFDADTALAGPVDAGVATGYLDGLDALALADKTDSMSFEWWYRGDANFVLQQAASGTGAQWQVYTTYEGASFELLDSSDTPACIVSVADDPTLHGVNHLVGTYDGSTETARLYINGELRATTHGFGGTGTLKSPPADPRAYVVIAQLITVDEIAFYDHALAPSRVALHYAAGTNNPSPPPGGETASYWEAVFPDGPNPWYRLAEQNGTTFADSSGNANDGDATDLFGEAHPPVLQAESLIVAEVGTDYALGGDPTPGNFCQGQVALVDPSAVDLAALTDSFSVEFWFARDPNGSSGPVAVSCTDVGGADMLWSAGINADGSGAGQIGNNLGGTGLICSIPEGTVEATLSPQHCVMTYDGSGGAGNEEVTVLVNAVPVAQATGFVGTLANPATPALRINIGNGIVMDEIAVYDHVLSYERIVAHYTQGITAP